MVSDAFGLLGEALFGRGPLFEHTQRCNWKVKSYVLIYELLLEHGLCIVQIAVVISTLLVRRDFHSPMGCSDLVDPLQWS